MEDHTCWIVERTGFESMRSYARFLLAIGLVGFLSACGSSGLNEPTGAAPESTSGAVHLTAAEVQTIIAQAATQAQVVGLPVTIAVVDHEGTRIGILQMAGARTTTTIQGGGSGGLEGVTLAGSAQLAAISKAGTAAFFGTQGNAFSTRSASFIVQEHFPPQVNPSAGGPLFGVQFSSLVCSDVSRTGHPAGTANLPLGLSADPGGLPLYKNGTAVGGIGVEGDGLYTLDRDPDHSSQTLEEVIAAAGTFGFSAPSGIRGDRILIDGMSIPFANAEPPASLNTITYSSFLVPPAPPVTAPVEIQVPIASPPTGFSPATIGGIPGSVDPNFPITASAIPGGLTVPEVTQLLAQAAVQANRTRAAIRNPLGSSARVSTAIVDTAGTILGIFRTTDAPIFGFDVSVQKARSANFFSGPTAAADLTAAVLGGYSSGLASNGVPLSGSIAFSDRGVGFLSQPFFPPAASAPFGPGPLSKPLGQWSIFNTGLQLDAIQGTLVNILLSGTPTSPCTQFAQNGTNPSTTLTPSLSTVANGFQIFPGSVPLYRGSTLVGAIGVSGDGVDQDDLIAAMGSAGFEAPAGIRSDTRLVQGVRLPYTVFPRNPNLF